MIGHAYEQSSWCYFVDVPRVKEIYILDLKHIFEVFVNVQDYLMPKDATGKLPEINAEVCSRIA